MGTNYRPKHVELIENINKIIIVASSWLFILLYQWRKSHERKKDRNNEKGEVVRTKMERNKHNNRVSTQLQLTNISYRNV